jgi:arsenate reductase
MRTFAVSVLSILLITATVGAQTGETRTVVFVCEHGSAKSIIAAAHFNRIAESKALPYRAISRGVHPDAEIPANIKAGLLEDGLDVSAWKPKLIANDDVGKAERVVTLQCELPKSNSIESSKLVEWDGIPPVSDGFTKTRSAIVERIEELLKTLPGVKPPNEGRAK